MLSYLYVLKLVPCADLNHVRAFTQHGFRLSKLSSFLNVVFNVPYTVRHTGLSCFLTPYDFTSSLRFDGEILSTLFLCCLLMRPQAERQL